VIESLSVDEEGRRLEWAAPTTNLQREPSGDNAVIAGSSIASGAPVAVPGLRREGVRFICGSDGFAEEL
jgi:hypothetical protein